MPLHSQSRDTTETSASLLVTFSREGAVNNATLTSNARAPGSHSHQAVTETRALSKKPSSLQQPPPPLLPLNGAGQPVGQQPPAPLAPRLSVSPGPFYSQCCQARGTGYQAPCPKEAREACRSTTLHPLAHQPLREEQLTSAYGHTLA